MRMRPAALEDFVGQEPPARARAARCARAIEEGHPHSMILYGPPGTGKTTLARIIAASTRAAFEEASAVEAGRAEVRAVIERAEHRRQTAGEPTIFFLDEIHRFNKAQQDALLPAVEEGLVTLIGATTENPYFEVNSALLSRTQVYELHAAERRGRAGAAAPRARARRVRRGAGRRRRAGVPGRPLRRRRAHRARPRSSWPARPPATARSRSSTPRTRSSARRCATTTTATSTTTTSRPGSRRRAARTPTPRCTTWR